MSASNTETPTPRPQPADTPDEASLASVKDKLGESGNALIHSAQTAAGKATEMAVRAGQSAKHKIARTEADAAALRTDEVLPSSSRLLKTGAAAAVSTVAVLAAVWLWRRRAKSQEDHED